MSIAIITPTRNRVQTIALLARWLRQQTVKPDLWVVVDDGEEEICFEEPMTHLVKRKQGPGEPTHSLCLNLRQALPYMLADKIFICEDDEYYAPTYIEEMSKRLDQYPVVGIGYSKYYHLGLRSPFVHENMQHASLAQTSFRREMIGEFIRCMADPKDNFIDIKFWKLVRSRGLIWRDADGYIPSDGKPGAQYVGMKGMPGNPGIGFGHKAMPGYRQDHTLEWLRRWIRPEDFSAYEKIAEQLWVNRKS
jgi:glycosyltransferase involved in cell wall biosynthesis